MIAPWAKEEMTTVDLGDNRLDARFPCPLPSESAILESGDGLRRQVMVGKGIMFPCHAIKDDEEAAWYVKWQVGCQIKCLSYKELQHQMAGRPVICQGIPTGILFLSIVAKRT
jgi:hypothetical protein